VLLLLRPLRWRPAPLGLRPHRRLVALRLFLLLLLVLLLLASLRQSRGFSALMLRLLPL
jgi:hypothetical protein